MKEKNRIIKRLKISTLVCLLTLFLFCCFLSSLLQAEELTLTHALQIAFQNSPSIRDSALQLEISEQNLFAEKAGLKSQFNLTLLPIRISSQRTFSDLISDYIIQNNTRTEARFTITQPIKWTDGTISISNRFNWQEASSTYTGNIKESNFNNSFTFSLSQPIFTYNRTKLAIRELELALENAQLNFAIRKLEIEKQVTEQFLGLYYSRKSIQIAKEQLKNATESYNIIKAKVDAGISASEELFQADLTRANSQAALENKLMQHENALDNFKILLGLPLEEAVDVTADVQKKIVEIDLEKAINHGLENRMELRQKDIEIQYALNNIIQAKAENEFKGSIDVSVGLTGANKAFQDIYESPNTDRLVAVSLNIPLFDWGRKKHHLAATEAQVETVKLSAAEEKKQIKYEIRQVYRTLQNQKIQIEIAEMNIKNAQATYEINLERYRSGELSSKDLQFYQLQLSEEKLNGEEALINYKLALLDLKIRTLWDFEANRSILDEVKERQKRED